MTALWLLHPDAERELSGASDAVSSERLRQQMEARRGLFAPLVQGDAAYFLHELDKAPAPEGPVFTWCPTPRVLRALRSAGLNVPRAPAVDVLRRVNEKTFLHQALSQLTLPGHGVAQSTAQLKAAVEAAPRLRVKRPFGFAGKGHRVLTPSWSPDDERWVEGGLRRGPLVFEPEQSLFTEHSLHGALGQDALILGSLCNLITDQYGAPVSVNLSSVNLSSVSPSPASTSPASLRGPTEEEEPAAIAQAVADALRTAGYFGPFGLDLLLKDGRYFLIDLNARFTLGWSTGLGPKRPDALALLSRLSAP